MHYRWEKPGSFATTARIIVIVVHAVRGIDRQRHCGSREGRYFIESLLMDPWDEEFLVEDGERDRTGRGWEGIKEREQGG